MAQRQFAIRLRKAREVWQAHRQFGMGVVGLWGSQIAGMGAGLLATLALARLLGTTEFGQFTFVQSLLGVAAILFDAGLSIAAGRLIGQSDNEGDQRAIAGAWCITLIPLLAAYVLLTTISSLWIDHAFRLGVSRLMLFSAVPAIGMPLQIGLRDVLQGSGALPGLRFLNLGPWVLFLLLVGLLYLFHAVSALAAIIAYFAAFAIITIAVIPVFLRPTRPPRGLIRNVLRETRSFGSHAFFGRVVGTSTYQLDTPLIALFTHSAQAVGFYSLASGFVSPIPLMSRALTVAGFRQLIRAERVPSGATQANLLWLVVSSAGAAAAAKPVVDLLLPSSYRGVLPLIYIWLIAAVLQGLYQLPNQFLVARRQGRSLRVMAVWFGIINLVTNLGLIPPFGSAGASWASVAANACWLGMAVNFVARLESPPRRSDQDVHSTGTTLEQD